MKKGLFIPLVAIAIPIFGSMVCVASPPSDNQVQSAGFTVVQDDILSNPANNGQENGWSRLFQPGAVRFEGHSYDATNTALLARVDSRHEANWATFGWITNGGYGSQSLTYAGVGTGNVVRAKFFMYATGQTGTASDQIPSLRMRVANRFAITATLIVKSQGYVIGNTLNADIAPVQTPDTPSVYKVDLDPPDTPRLVSNGANESFLRAFEIYDNAPQMNGSIGMTESQIGIYPAFLVADAGTTVVPVTSETGLIKSYEAGTDGGDFGTLGSPNVAITLLKVNGLSVDPTGGQPTAVGNALGIVMDTLSVESDRMAFAGFDNFGGTDEYPRTTATRQSSARVEPGKMYSVKFHMTSTLNCTSQSMIRLRAKSLAFDWTSTLEILNGRIAGTNDALLASEFMPGIGNAIPEVDRIPGDTTGGWYKVILPSPMDPEIKQNQPALAAQDPPGITTLVSSNSRSRRDIQTGVDLHDSYVSSPSSSVGQLQVDKIQIHKLNAVE